MTATPNPPAPQGSNYLPMEQTFKAPFAPDPTPSAPKAEQVPQEVREIVERHAAIEIRPGLFQRVVYAEPMIQALEALIVAERERYSAEIAEKAERYRLVTLKQDVELIQLRRELEFERKVKWELAQQLAALQRENDQRLERGVSYERPEDMSPKGRLAVFIESDGDIIVTCRGVNTYGEPQHGSVQFCTTGSGGGRSSKTRAALLALAAAIVQDNGGNPEPSP